MGLFDGFVDGNAYLDINGLSKHINADRKYNENNPGIGIRYEWGEDDLRKFLMLGQYLNSLKNATNYAGGGIKTRLFGDNSLHLDAGVTGGVLSGYGPGLLPAILPTLSVGTDNVGLTLMAAPPVELEGKKTPAVLMLNSQYKF